MGMTLDRQLFINGITKWCDHLYEDVRSEDGKHLYGGRCARCSATWALGECDGCRLESRHLTVSTLSGRYCNAECQEVARRLQAKAARQEAKGAPIPWKCEHKHTEGVLAEGGHLLGVRCLGCFEVLPP